MHLLDHHRLTVTDRKSDPGTCVIQWQMTGFSGFPAPTVGMTGTTDGLSRSPDVRSCKPLIFFVDVELDG